MMIGNVWLSAPMIPELTATLNVHRTTVARWIEKRRIPEGIYALLDITKNGNIGRIHAAWEGWKIDPRSGDLQTPANQTISPGVVMSYPYRGHEVSELRNKNAALERRCTDQAETIAEQQRRIEKLESYLEKSQDRNVIEWRKRNLG